MELLPILIEEMQHYDGYTVHPYHEYGIFLMPEESKRYYMPNIIIKDISKFEAVLNEYITLIKERPKKFYKLDDKHTISHYLFYLTRAPSQTDCQDFTSYVKRVIEYLKEDYFSDLDYSQELGMLDEYKLSTRRCEEYYGSETPYTMHFHLDAPGIKFEMPIVRYGISEDNIAYLYSVQRKKIYNNEHRRIKAINSIFNRANSGVKENRNVPPAMLCSLTVFLGMLKSQNISKIKADGFLTRRYGTVIGAETEEERRQIAHNSITIFLKLFYRIESQFEGIDIQYYPLEADSYLHINISDEAYSNNELLNHLFNLGLNYSKDETKSKLY